MRSLRRGYPIVILGLTLLAFLLRAYRLDFQSYWIDEGWTLYFARLPLDQLWNSLQTTEPKPPLYYVLSSAWIRWAGDGEFALRYLSLAFGVLVIPLTYRMGKALGDARLGGLAAVLMAIAPYQIWHSQDARMYSIFSAAAAMSMWGFVTMWQRGGWRGWLVYVIGTEWALMTHYHAVLLVGLQGLFLLMTWRRHWRRYWIWATALVAVGLLFTPWLVLSSSLLRTFLHRIPQPTLWDSYLRSVMAFSVGEDVPRWLAIPLTLVFVAIYVMGIVTAGRRSWGRWRGGEMVARLLAYTLAPAAAAWLYGELRTPVFMERYLIPVQGRYLLAVAAGILALGIGPRQWLAWGAPLLAAGLVLGLLGIDGWVLSHQYADPAYAKPDWRATARTIEALGLPGDAIVITGDGGEKVFNTYYRGTLPLYLDFNTPVPPADRARQTIAGIAAAHDRIWYSPYGVTVDALLEAWLGRNAYPAWQSWLGRNRLALYAGSAAVTDRRAPLDITFGQGQPEAIDLLAVDLPQGPTPAGDVLPLTLTWSTPCRLEHDYQVSLRLAGAEGDTFVQSDWPPLAAEGHTSAWTPGQLVTDRRGLWLPPDLPPGEYALQLVTYATASGQPLGQPASIPGVRVGPAPGIVPAQALSIPNPIQRQLGDLALVGYAAPGSLRPGEELRLWLYWQNGSQGVTGMAEALRVTVTSQDKSAATDFPLAVSLGGLDSWQPGQVRRAVYHVPGNPRLAGNQAEVRLALLGTDGHPLAELPLTTIPLEPRQRQFQAPTMSHASDVTLGRPAMAKLIGYDGPSGQLTAGSQLAVTLYWQALADMAADYTVFVQLLSGDWQVVAQRDMQPQAGRASTTTWLPGEVVADAYSLQLPEKLPAGAYRLIAGMYDAATGQRLPTSDPAGQDRIELTMVTIE
jgi:hypothetical protein